MGPKVRNCNSFASNHYLAICDVAHGQANIASPKLHSGSNIISDSHPFRSKSIGPPIPVIWLFENLTSKIQVQGHV